MAAAPADAIDQLAAFVSANACAAYRVEAPSQRLLTKTEVDTDLATDFTTTPGDDAVLFGPTRPRAGASKHSRPDSPSPAKNFFSVRRTGG